MKIVRSSLDTKHDFEQVVTLVVRERRRKMYEAIRSLWRIGDAVRRLKRVVARGNWTRTLDECAARVGLHAMSLADAARAAEAFTPRQRQAVRTRFERAGAELTPSHVVELARASPRERARGLEALLRNSFSIRDLRAYLNR